MNGYSQIHGLDYHEFFSPVMKIVSISLFLALATNKNGCQDNLFE
jgi:hypothetical protein